eukprot:gb/GECG01014010.1/.p1 GENE.gb/GECG01014010.1/~~gb/GECG01014010.1/.p1  ORF type:complete len:105 (+),score=3.54 gb/GECG01014010.1/:1-315(+)
MPLPSFASITSSRVDNVGALPRLYPGTAAVCFFHVSKKKKSALPHSSDTVNKYLEASTGVLPPSLKRLTHLSRHRCSTFPLLTGNRRILSLSNEELHCGISAIA